jgi:hypothetical protein
MNSSTLHRCRLLKKWPGYLPVVELLPDPAPLRLPPGCDWARR